jgi:hypothetical protein
MKITELVQAGPLSGCRYKPLKTAEQLVVCKVRHHDVSWMQTENSSTIDSSLNALSAPEESGN